MIEPAETDAIKALLRDAVSDMELGLTEPQYGQLAAHFCLLLKWNRKMNLTSLRRPEDIAKRHFAESLYLAKILPLTEASSQDGLLVDVGSGAGFPGLPLKVAWPFLHAVMLEPNNKKAAFLKEAVRECGLQGTEVRSERLEAAVESHSGRASLVTMRAVDSSGDLLPNLKSFLRPGGYLALFLGAADAMQARKFSDLEWAEPASIPYSDRRVILIGKKHDFNVPRGT